MADAVGRLGDNAKIDACCHGCNGCCHPCKGPAVSGSKTVFVNGRPIVRETDKGIHAACCGANEWQTMTYSATVKANNLGVHRKGDTTQHCGGLGELIEGSDTVVAG